MLEHTLQAAFVDQWPHLGIRKQRVGGNHRAEVSMMRSTTLSATSA